MRILSIDTSCKTAMAAVSEDARVIAAVSIQDQKTHSVKMLPAIEYILNVSDTDRNDIGLVAVTNGPGSYTGLRIGVTTAKTFAYALKVPLVGINSLEALAASCAACGDTLICPVMDARNARVYAALYKDGAEIMQTAALSCEELSERLKSEYEGSRIIFTGDGAYPNAETFSSLLGKMFAPLPETLSFGNPAAIAMLAYEKYRNAVSDGSIGSLTADGLKVEYYKKYTVDI